MMDAEIVQINVSRGGLPKRAVASAVLTPLGLEGDDHAHPRIHGGPLKAILLIGTEAIERLIAAGYPIFPGALGENLTTSGLDYALLRAGHRLRVGATRLELTTLRVPCNTLDMYGPEIKKEMYDKRVKNGDFTSPRWAVGGFYARVITPGEISKGDSVVVESVLA